MRHTVKAAVMVAPGQLEVKEFPFPVVAEDAMLLEVELCGICGTDKHNIPWGDYAVWRDKG